MSQDVLIKLPNCMSCGAPLSQSNQIKPGLIKCPSCKNEYYVKDAYSESVISKLEHANRRRMEYHFDEAYEEYESLARQEPNLIEAHWGLFLSTYGIVHVKDSDEGRHIPTMNRYLDDSVSKNKHLKTVLELADNEEKKNHFLSEANYIEDIRNTIQGHMKNQDQYDIFICYKSSVETEHGRMPTVDSKHAQSIYRFLIDQGYKNIFFAEETLKGKPGANWEAAIYTALSSAKVMLLLCSKEDFIKAPWVKNEWSRFIKYMEWDPTKALLPIRIQNFDFNLLPQKIKPFQGIDLETVDFKDHLLSFVQKNVVTRLGERIKKRKIEVVEERNVNRQPVEIVTRKIGGQNITDYKINPSLDLKIQNAMKIYMNRNKFSAAMRQFDEVIQADPHAKEAIWGKILCLMTVQDFKDIAPNKSVKNTYDVFNQLMNAISKEEAPTYVEYYKQFCLKKLEKTGEFDGELFDFILGWCTPEEQEEFSGRLYNLILAEMLSHPTIDKWLMNAMDAATKTLPQRKTKTFIKRYLTISEKLIQNQKFPMVKSLLNVVLGIDAFNDKANELLFLCKYKVIDMPSFSNQIEGLEFVPDLEQLLKTGYKDRAVFDAIYDAAVSKIKKQTKKAVELFDTFSSYIPEHFDSFYHLAILQFANHLIMHEKYDIADKYLLQHISDFPQNAEAYFIRMKVTLKMKNYFEVLVNYDKELMDIQDYANAVNSTTANQHFIEFMDLHTELHKKTKASKIMKKQFMRFLENMNDFDGTVTSKTFVHSTFPEAIASLKNMEAHRHYTRKAVFVRFLSSTFILIGCLLLAILLSGSINETLAVFREGMQGVLQIFFIVSPFLGIYYAVKIYNYWEERKGYGYLGTGEKVVSYILGSGLVVAFGGAVYLFMDLLYQIGSVDKTVMWIIFFSAFALLTVRSIHRGKGGFMKGPLEKQNVRMMKKWTWSVLSLYTIIMVVVIMTFTR